MRLHVLHMHAFFLVCKSVMYDPLASQSAEEVSELSRLAQQQQWTKCKMPSSMRRRHASSHLHIHRFVPWTKVVKAELACVVLS